MFIDEAGNVLQSVVKRSSGNCTLDRAALETVKIMTFDPARLHGTPVRVWVDMPIIFRTR